MKRQNLTDSLPDIKTAKPFDKAKFLRLAKKVKKIFEEEERALKKRQEYENRNPSGFLSSI